MRELVLQPCGMERSTIDQPLPAARLPEAAIGHRSGARPVSGGHHVYPQMAAAGLWTTPSDLARFAHHVRRAAAGEPGAETAQRERRHGFKSRFRYRHAVEGFSARLSASQVARLKADPEVAAVVPDRRVHAVETLASGDSAPFGVRRIGAATTSTVRGAAGVNVAVIDSGVDLAHPDLNVVSGVNCVTPGTAAQDDNGHGTHVAGTIAARNNGSGVV
ncbi:MAG: S8 family serine peptidase, partial [Actinomycetota bacterium]|nr:S8 family serine peptidase [Actinomycetota bacterium]